MFYICLTNHTVVKTKGLDFGVMLYMCILVTVMSIKMVEHINWLSVRCIYLKVYLSILSIRRNLSPMMLLVHEESSVRLLAACWVDYLGCKWISLLCDFSELVRSTCFINVSEGHTW